MPKDNKKSKKSQPRQPKATCATSSEIESCTYPTKWLLHHISRINETMPERSFCFILGSGASAESGIPTAGPLVDGWLSDIQLRDGTEDCKLPLKEWTALGKLNIPGFAYERKEEFYPDVFKERFKNDPDEGYAELERLMDRATPSFGYAVLAQILTSDKVKCRVVITTNFDNLVADALFLFSNTSPFVCGHESLTDFVRPHMRRPLIAKIHRDVFLAPLNMPEQLKELEGGWNKVLKDVLRFHTPIVIGYGGNDGTLMGLLDKLLPGDIEGQLVWCYRPSNRLPKQKIADVVLKHKGAFVQISSFDELMLQIGERFELPLLDLIANMEKDGKNRAEEYKKKFQDLQNSIREPLIKPEEKEAKADAQDAVDRLIERSKGWWKWDLKAQAESNPEIKEQIYREGLKELQERSPGLLNNFALFMIDVREDYDEAERLYRKAIELDPNNANITGNLANFMADVRKDHDEAERLYRKAIELDPNNAYVTGNLANFTSNVRKDHDEGERLYRKAMELDPNNAIITGNLASFMAYIGHDHDEAERLYRKAIELDPNDASITGNLANFMTGIRKDNAGAERFYRKALELDPDDADINTNYSAFLLSQGNIGEARQRAFQAFKLGRDYGGQSVAEALLYLTIIEIIDKDSAKASLGRLKRVLKDGYRRGMWSFKHVFDFASTKLSLGDMTFCRALGDAVLDEDMVKDLDAFTVWTSIEAIPLDEPWPEIEKGTTEG